jgi:hypothetical protein
MPGRPLLDRDDPVRDLAAWRCDGHDLAGAMAHERPPDRRRVRDPARGRVGLRGADDPVDDDFVVAVDLLDADRRSDVDAAVGARRLDDDAVRSMPSMFAIRPSRNDCSSRAAV